MTIAALRALLDQELPHVPRHPAPRLTLPPWTAKEPPVQQPDTPGPAPALPDDLDEAVTWALDHADPAVRTLGETAHQAVTALYQHRARLAELTRIQGELGKLEARAEALRARQAELQPPKPKKARQGNDAAKVRAWAATADIEVPARGRVPADVVAAWRTATGQA